MLSGNCVACHTETGKITMKVISEWKCGLKQLGKKSLIPSDWTVSQNVFIHLTLYIKCKHYYLRWMAWWCIG